MDEVLLRAHYRSAVRAVEKLIRQRVPFMPEPARLTDPEVDFLADLFVAGHLIANGAAAQPAEPCGESTVGLLGEPLACSLDRHAPGSEHRSADGTKWVQLPSGRIAVDPHRRLRR